MTRGRPPICPCGSTDSVSKGIRKTKTMGNRRIRRCKKCGRKFTPRNQKPNAPQNSSASELSTRG